MQTRTDTPPHIVVSHPGAVPIVLSLVRIAGIRKLIEQSTGWTPVSEAISPGILAETLVAALLCGSRPIYKVEAFFEHNDFIELFYKDDGISWCQLNDDAYGRMLDTLSTLDLRKLYESICLNLLQYHSLDISLTHSDTTSVSVEGVYLPHQATSPEEGEANTIEPKIEPNGTPKKVHSDSSFCINHGHSKDRRPELKQYKFGLSVQENGLPISGELMSGNTSDKNWTPRAVEEISDMISGNGYKNVIFLADSAVISTDTIHRFAQRGIQFISRFPETFNLANDLITEAWEENSWEDIGTFAEHQKNAAHYKTRMKTCEIEGVPFGFVVVYSSKLEERKEKTLRKRVENKKKELQKESKELFKKDFACEVDARNEGILLQKKVIKRDFMWM